MRFNEDEFEIRSEDGAIHVKRNMDGSRTITYPDGHQIAFPPAVPMIPQEDDS